MYYHKVANEVLGQVLVYQTSQFNAVPLIPKDQLDEMVLPAGGPLKMNMSVENVAIEDFDQELQLKSNSDSPVTNHRTGI